MNRYQGAQNKLERCGATGCLFLSIMSIAEEFSGEHYDLLDAIDHFVMKGYMKPDYTCIDQERMLEDLTGHSWKKVVMTTLPSTIPDNMYTIAKYKKGLTKTHFRRRGWDVYEGSETVRNGKLVEYYCYFVED